MNQKLLRTVSVCALVAAVSGAAVAQTGGSGGGAGGGGSPSGGSAPQTQQRTPDSGGGDAGRGTQSPNGETVQPKSSPGETRQPGATQQRSDDRATPRKQDRSDTKSDQKQRPQASDGDRKGDGKRATDRTQDKDRTRTGQDQRGQDKDRARTGQDQRGQDKDRARTGQDQRDRGDSSRQGQADRGKDAGRRQLSEQQRTSVRDRFRSSGIERNRVTNVNFAIRVGASVPRSVTLHTLPAGVVEIVPQYRGYRYVYVNDDIVIVDPGTYAVVAVVSSSGGRAAGPRGSRSLTLAAPDRVFVREHIDRGASIRLGIGAISIGMSVPQGVELLPMPRVVVDRYPNLGEYRYFVYEDDIAIVDPSSDEVVMIVAD
jgi:hypothetical protein